MSDKLRIAWFSNIDKEKEFSLSGYVSNKILPHIHKEFSLKVYHNSFDKLSWIDSGHFLRARQDHLNDPYDLFFYNFEDAADSRFIRIALGLMPGVVYFHNFVLADDGPEPILNSAWTDTIGRFNGTENEWPLRGKEYTAKRPYAYREAAWSIIPIFSSPHLLNQYNSESGLKLNNDVGKSFYLPIPVDQVSFEANTQSDKDIFTICFCGSSNIEHRPHKLLQALESLSLKTKLIWMTDGSEKRWVHEFLKDYPSVEVELVIGKGESLWLSCLRRSSLAMHTYFSVYGTTSPYFEISLMQGIPSVINDFASAEYLPDNLVFKVQPGETESLGYQSVINQVAGLTQNELQALRKGVSQFANESFNTQMVARELSYVLRESALALKPFYRSWNDFTDDARGSLLEEVTGFYKQNFESLNFSPDIMNFSFNELGWSK